MLPRPQGISFSKVARAAWLATVILPFCSTESSYLLVAAEKPGNIVCRENVSTERRKELAAKLQKITGWPDLNFDRSGVLRGEGKTSTGGSRTAREFIASVMRGPAVVVLEDASKNPEVAFCRVNPGRWKEEIADNPPGYVVQIDFSDFEHVMGDERALEAFDVGWGLLHELDHIVNDSRDAASLGEPGECEDHINQMRRECDLPQRASYFFTLLPLTTDTTFMTRLVRMPFEQEQTPRNKKKRYWLVWDAKAVGGLEEQEQIASLR